jgi:starvation-inducible DNA-binding protein
MRAPFSDMTIDSGVVARSADCERLDTITILDELLVHSLRLRNLYRYGRWQTADLRARRLHHLFDGHYKEQLRLVDVLIDRIRMVGGTGRVLGADFLQDTQFSYALRGRQPLTRLLRELRNTHELVLSVARPERQINRSWARDFAVGQVVLSNDLQNWSVSEQCATFDTRQTFRQTQCTET